MLVDWQDIASVYLIRVLIEDASAMGHSYCRSDQLPLRQMCAQTRREPAGSQCQPQ